MEELTSTLTRLRMGRYAITDLRKKIDPELRDVKKGKMLSIFSYVLVVLVLLLNFRIRYTLTGSLIKNDTNTT